MKHSIQSYSSQLHPSPTTTPNPLYLQLSRGLLTEADVILNLSSGDTSEAAIEERLETAKKELQYSTAKDFWDTTVVNDQVEATNKTVEEFLNV